MITRTFLPPRHHTGATFLLKACLKACLGAALLTASSLASAKGDWWFDVEVILFKRDTLPQQLAEQFDTPTQATKLPRRKLELLTNYIHPKIDYLRQNLPVCFAKFEPLPAAHLVPYIEALDYLPQVEMDLADTAGQALQAGETDQLFEQLQQPMAIPAEEDDKNVLSDIDQQILAQPLWPENVRVPASLACRYEEEDMLVSTPFSPQFNQPAEPDAVPVEIDGAEWEGSISPYLLAKKSLEMKDIYQQLRRQKDSFPLLHLGWRQEVEFGENKSPAMHIIAGANYGIWFDANGKRLPVIDETAEAEQVIPVSDAEATNNALFAKIDRVLAGENLPFPEVEKDNTHGTRMPKPAAVWELEGLFKVYLKNLGRTPYLHIDSDLDLRVPVYDAKLDDADANAGPMSVSNIEDANRLKTYHFDQLRRIISNQIHYFDHPMLGMIVQVRRYHLPESFTSKQ